MAKSDLERKYRDPVITFEEAHEWLRYDPETGFLHWKKQPCGWIAEGAIAGTLARGYWRVKIGPHKYMGHRLVWFMAYGAWPEGTIDHISGNPSDNRLSNLRVVNAAENNRNAKRARNNRSGVTGVRWNYQHRKWRAYICIDNKSVYLGAYVEFDDAVAARKNAEAAYGYHPNHGRDDPLTA